MTWKLIDTKTGAAATYGEIYQTFRDEPVTLIGGIPPEHDGSTGRISVRDADGRTSLFYPKVCGLKWQQEIKLPETLNGFPVIDIAPRQGGDGFVVIVKRPQQNHPFVQATWFPELGTGWQWGHYLDSYSEALKLFDEKAVQGRASE